MALSETDSCEECGSLVIEDSVLCNICESVYCTRCHPQGCPSDCDTGEVPSTWFLSIQRAVPLLNEDEALKVIILATARIKNLHKKG